jgi:Adenosine deaminase
MATGRDLRALPKAHLHVLLEGSMRPTTVVELARRHGVELPDGLREGRYEFRDFRHFIAEWDLPALRCKNRGSLPACLTTDREQAWSPEETIEEQIEREAKELQLLLEAVRNLGQARSLHGYVFQHWRAASHNDQEALKPTLGRRRRRRPLPPRRSKG